MVIIFLPSCNHLGSKHNSFPNYGLMRLTMKSLAECLFADRSNGYVTVVIGGLSDQLKVTSGQAPY